MLQRCCNWKNVKSFKKISMKFQNPTFNKFLQNNIYKMSTICNLHVNKTVLEQVKVAVELWLHAFQFFEKQKLCKQRSRNSALQKFLIKIYLQSFSFSYYVIIYSKPSTKVFFTTWAWLWNSISSVKLKISRATSFQNAPWVSSIFHFSQ